MIKEQLIKREKFTSIQEAQAGLTGILTKAEREGFFYRVLRNNSPLGVLLPNAVWESLLEDLDGINSPNYLKSVAEARKSSKKYSSKQVRKELNIK